MSLLIGLGKEPSHRDGRQAIDWLENVLLAELEAINSLYKVSILRKGFVAGYRESMVRLR